MNRAPLVLALLLAGLALAFVAGCSSEDERFQAYVASAEAKAADQNWREAEIELRRALQLRPQDGDVNLRLGRVMEKQEKWSDALFFYEESWRLDPEHPEGALEAARLLIGEDADGASELVEAVIARHPEEPIAYVRRAGLALVKGDTDAALAAAQTATQLGPDDVETWVSLGRVQMTRARKAKQSGEGLDPDALAAALAAFERGIKVGGPGSIAALERARLLSITPGRVEEVPAALRAVLAAAPPEDKAFRAAVGRTMIQYGTNKQDLAMIAEGIKPMIDFAPGNVALWAEWAAIEEQREPGGGDRVFDQLISSAPKSAVARDRYALFLGERGRLDDAERELRAGIEKVDQPSRLLARLAELLRQTGRTADAEAVQKTLQQDYPNDPFALASSAQQAMQRGDYKVAVEQLGKATTMVEEAELFRQLAFAQLRRGNLPAAEDAIGRAAKASPAVDPMTPRLHAEIRFTAHDWVGTIRALRDLHRLGVPLQPREKVWQAVSQYELGRNDVGRNILQPMLDEPEPPTIAVIAFAQREADRDPDAVRRVLDAALDRHPGDPALVRQRVNVELVNRKPDAALAVIDGALRVFPDDADLHVMRGELLLRRGDAGGAVTEANAALAVDPHMARARGLLAQAYRQEGRLAELESTLEKASAAGELDVRGRVLLASLKSQQGKRGEAIEMLEAVLVDAPDDTFAQNDLAYLLAREGRDLERAVELARAALAAAPDDPTVGDTLGYVYLKRGLTGPALSQLDFALEHAPGGGDARALLVYHRGLVLAAMQREEEARKAFVEARSLSKDLPMDELPPGYEEAAAAPADRV